MNPELKHLEVIAGKVQLPESTEQNPIRERLTSVLSEAEKVEANKDKLDLKPNIDFVSANIDKFETGLDSIYQREPDEDSKAWSEGIAFGGTDDIVSPQVSSDECKQILARMPKSLIEMSKLETVDYHTFGNVRVIPVPGFNEQGNFDSSKVQLVPVSEFPRKGDHPSRILVGVSNGTKIYPTPIPKSVSEDERAVYLYQVHVLLHEFFHTVDYPRRSPEDRSKILLEVDGQQFTFQDWWMAFEELILSGNEPQCVSSYANTYFDDLNQETREIDYKKFTHALAEQICETFVACQLDIISNDEGWTDFKKEGFGNVSQLTKHVKEESESANLKWVLMDKLCRAIVVKQEE
ncbi:MAG: hypothetical protein AAB647_04325 [Patescibacteria group bacterium]